MKTRLWVTDHRSAQRAIDRIKEVYQTGDPHEVIIRPPTKDASSDQRIKAMTLVSMIAQETGEQDIDRMKDMLLNEMGWFSGLAEELKPMRISLTKLDKAQTSHFIDLLENFAAENGWRTQ